MLPKPFPSVFYPKTHHWFHVKTLPSLPLPPSDKVELQGECVLRASGVHSLPSRRNLVVFTVCCPCADFVSRDLARNAESGRLAPPAACLGF